MWGVWGVWDCQKVDLTRQFYCTKISPHPDHTSGPSPPPRVFSIYSADPNYSSSPETGFLPKTQFLILPPQIFVPQLNLIREKLTIQFYRSPETFSLRIPHPPFYKQK